jgi:high-affinity iron transporter
MRALVLLAVVLAVLAGRPAAADEASEPAQLILHMLGYVAVDYPEAVKEGRIVSADEYQEQIDFVTQALERLEQLSARPERAGLIERTRRLLALIQGQRPDTEVAALVAEIRDGVVAAYAVPVAPARPPDVGAAAALYAARCAACHGASGHGDGPAAKGLEPPPTDFHDRDRASKRTVHELYATIRFGLRGTAMPAFTDLSDDARWSLAFHVASFAGGALGRSLRLLDASLDAFRNGRVAAAQDLAVTSYLDGFELVEPALDAVDRGLRQSVEAEMIRYRAMLRAGSPIAQVEAQVATLRTLLARAERALSGSGLGAGAAFAGAFAILLREGLEAILVVAAVLAIVRRAGRRDALVAIHAGWLGALALGAVTWVAATYLIAISGATREALEGGTALLAAAILLLVGFWLHDKAHADRWTAYLGRRLDGAMGARTRGSLALVAFLAVYREAFETVLFYQALWVQLARGAVDAFLGGAAAAAVCLVALGWLIIRGSLRLPIGPFFNATAALLALLAVVLAGQGIAALQEAGLLDVHPIAGPRLPMLGVYPDLVGTTLQVLVLLLVVAGALRRSRSARRPRPATPAD